MTIDNRYDFVMIFDVENGNPNGDPDAGNAPRVDAETGYGYITDVCLKRKIRNYVELVKEGQYGYSILIKNDRTLNSKFKEAYTALGLQTGQNGKNKEDVILARDWMCEHYYDVRAFGAVMSTGDKGARDSCGIVRGPVQLNFGRSISPVTIEDVTITRTAITNEKDEDKDNTMGRKSIIPYGLYRAEGYVSAALAQKMTKLSDEDVELLWDAIINMFENDHSAARGKMCMRKLFVFKHDCVLGNCPSHILFDKIKISQTSSDAPRAFSDYEISVDKQMPGGVEFIEKL